MAIVTVASDLLPSGPNATKNAPANRQLAALCGSRFTVPALVAAADIGSTIRICKLPANGRYLAGYSKLLSTAGGAGALVSLGHESYRDTNGSTVPANPTFFGTGFSVAAAGTAFLDTLTTPVHEWDVPNDVILTLTVAGANLPVGFSMAGTIAYLAAFIG